MVVSANFNAPLMVGQTGNTLTCDVSGADSLNPTIIYQWIRNDDSIQTQVGSSKTFDLSPLRLSSAGEYTCRATIGSNLLNNDIPVSAGNTQRVVIQSEFNLMHAVLCAVVILTLCSNSLRSTVCYCD